MATAVDRAVRPRSAWLRGDSLLLLPAALLFLVVLVLPLLLLLPTALNPSIRGVVGIEPAFTLANFLRLFTQDVYTDALLNSILFGVITAAGAVLLGFPVAFVIANTHSLRRLTLMTLLLLIPFQIDIIGRVFGLIVLLGDNGLINSSLAQLGVIGRPLPLMYNKLGVVFGTTQFMLPFVIFALVGSLKTIHPELLQAGRSLGATYWSAFRKIVLPLSLPGIAAGVWRDGEVVLRIGVGHEDGPGSRPVDGETVFHLASVTKTFVATAVMQLVERGVPVSDEPKSSGERILFAERIGRDPTFRPAGWESTFSGILTNEMDYVREVAVECCPMPAGAAFWKIIPERLRDRIVVLSPGRVRAVQIQDRRVGPPGDERACGAGRIDPREHVELDVVGRVLPVRDRRPLGRNELGHDLGQGRLCLLGTSLGDALGIDVVTVIAGIVARPVEQVPQVVREVAEVGRPVVPGSIVR